MHKHQLFAYHRTLELEEALKIKHFWDLPGGPVVKNLTSNAGDAGSIPGQGTKIPHAVGQLSRHATTIELACLNERAHVLCCNLQSPRTLDPPCHN